MRTNILAAVVMATILCTSLFLDAATYYVNNTPGVGSDTNNGSSGAPWKTLSHAASQISTNDTVYVKATPQAYGSFVIDSADSGVKFIGYAASTPPTSDLDDGSGVPEDYSEIINTGSTRGFPDISDVDNSPRIDGGTRYSGTAVSINASSVQFRNFWIYNANVGLRLTNADFCLVKNVYVFNCGGPDNSNHSDGRGIQIESDSALNVVNNCVCYNVGHIAFNIHDGSDGNYIQHSHAMCDDDSGGLDSNTHYYFDVANNTDSNVVEYCIAERLHDPTVSSGDSTLDHQGHGFVLQAWDNDTLTYTCDDNEFYMCVAYNISQPFLVRGPGVENTYLDCTSILVEGEESDVQSSGLTMYGGICLDGGPIDTLFQNIRIANGNSGVRVFGSGDKYTDSTTAGDGNVFYNCIFECNKIGIELSSFPDESTAGSNLQNGSTRDFVNNGFLNCNFIATDTGAYLFRFAREESDNVMVNCIFDGFDGWNIGVDYVAHNSGYVHTLGSSATYCLFHDNSGFDSSFTSGNDTTGIPDFAETTYYTIGSNSDCIDNGLNVSTYGTSDFDWTSRDSSYDIGAQEYVAQ